MSASGRVLSNLMWRFAERCGAQLVSFIVSVVLARILEPDAYGTIALITVFTTLLQVFVDSGLGNALIQKKDADDLDFSTVFYTNLAFCTVLYLLVFAASPVIAAFYDRPEMVPYIRVLAITLLISGVKNVQQAYVSKHMLFRVFFFSTLGGTIAAGVIGVSMALMGFGIWALIAQQLINLTIDTCILWITVRWRPRAVYSLARLRGLYSYGWKLLASSFLDKLYSNLNSLIIGKLYSAKDLAYFNQGDKFPRLVIENINTSIDSVLFPAMAEEQDDVARVKNMTRRAIRISTYVLAPMLLGLAAAAEPLVRLVLTDKWLFSVPFMRIFCMSYVLYPVHTANLNAIKAMGRSDIFLKLEIFKKVLGLIMLLISMWFGVTVIAWCLFLTSLLSQLINSAPNKRLLNYGYLEQLKDMLPNLACAAAMALGVYSLQFLGLGAAVTLVLQIGAGVVLYLALSVVFHLGSFRYVLDMVREMAARKRG